MYASLYPSVYRQFNIAPNTLIGMLIINNRVHNKENKCCDTKWRRSGAFMEDLQSNMWLEFCARWFNFPRYETLYHDIIEFFTRHAVPQRGCMRKFDRNGLINPIVFNDIRTPDGLIEPIVKSDEYRLINPIIYDEDYSHEEKPIVYFDRKKVEEMLNVLTKTPNQQFRV